MCINLRHESVQYPESTRYKPINISILCIKNESIDTVGKQSYSMVSIRINIRINKILKV